MIHGFHHVAVITANYARSKRFYTQVLGLSVIGETYRAERESYKLDLALPGGGQLELFSFPTPPQRLSGPEAAGLRHLCFSVTDLKQTIEHLSHHQVACEPIRIDPGTGCRFTFARDPDDLPLEFYEIRGERTNGE